MQANYLPYLLRFNFPAGTSRGVMYHRPIWFLVIADGDKIGIGECAPLEGLSMENNEEAEQNLSDLCRAINNQTEIPQLVPSVTFALEMATRDLTFGGHKIFGNNSLVKGKGIKINGLIWMGDQSLMLKRIEEKLLAGFTCLKLKIGALNFEDELSLIKHIRKHYSERDIELRLDANGAFKPNEALKKLEQLYPLGIHSVEQPIKDGQWDKMAEICSNSPISIALDEELIGLEDDQPLELLEYIQPQYIILKPSLLGGFKACEKWIKAAGEMTTPWWITSALESNLGLNAIAQFTSAYENPLPQGLGTGQVFSNNIPSPLEINKDLLVFNPEKPWDFSNLNFSGLPTGLNFQSKN